MCGVDKGRDFGSVLIAAERERHPQETPSPVSAGGGFYLSSDVSPSMCVSGAVIQGGVLGFQAVHLQVEIGVVLGAVNRPWMLSE